MRMICQLQDSRTQCIGSWPFSSVPHLRHGTKWFSQVSNSFSSNSELDTSWLNSLAAFLKQFIYFSNTVNLFIHFQEGVTEPPEQSGSIAVQDLREETSGLGDSEMAVVVRACSLSSTLLIIPKGNLINLQEFLLTPSKKTLLVKNYTLKSYLLF